MTGVVLALPGLNVFSVDDLSTGFQFLQTTQPNDNNFHVFTLTNVASASSAVGDERDVVFTATQINARLQNATYLVDDLNRILGVSSGSNVTPTAHIEWDGIDGNALSLNPTGLGGVDVVSSTNTGFVLEINQDDLAATLIVKAYTDGSNWSERTVLLPGNVDANSHIDYFVSFSHFTPTAGTGVNFANLGAITWDLLGVNSLDFQISNYVADTVWDFGDLPDTYSTTLASGGPYHNVTFLRLGNNVDSESTGQPDTAALGDDNDGNAPYLPGDEEGVTHKTGTFPNYTKWFTGTNGGAVNVTMKGCGSLVTCYLSGWVDWNNDGNFNQAGDQIFNNLALD